MKIALFLFLALLNCSTLFAYEVKITKLTDKEYDPVTEDVSCFASADEYKKNHEGFVILAEQGHKLLHVSRKCNKFAGISPDTQIATVTLVFGRNEIGQDKDAVIQLAKKEAKKLGADFIFYVSDTRYENTQELASMTFRCVRTGGYEYSGRLAKAERENKNIEKELSQQLMKKSSFFGKFFIYKLYFMCMEYDSGREIDLHANLENMPMEDQEQLLAACTKDILLAMLKVGQKKEDKSKFLERYKENEAFFCAPLSERDFFEKRKEAAAEQAAKQCNETLYWDPCGCSTYFDEKSGKQLNFKEFSRRYRELFADKLISLFKENFKGYLSEKDRLKSILQKYPKSSYSYFFRKYIFNELDLKENINYEDWKKYFLSQTEDLAQPWDIIHGEWFMAFWEGQ